MRIVVTLVRVKILFMRVEITLCVWKSNSWWSKANSAFENHTLRLKIALCM
jgi:hypothetical protein